MSSLGSAWNHIFQAVTKNVFSYLTYLMPRVDIIKPFHLDQKLLKIISCDVSQRFWNEFVVVFFVLATFSIRNLSRQRFCFPWSISKGNSLRQRRKWNCYLIPCSGQLLKDVTDVEEILQGKKVYRVSSLIHFLTTNTLRYTDGTFCTTCQKPLCSLQQKLFLFLLIYIIYFYYGQITGHF